MLVCRRFLSALVVGVISLPGLAAQQTAETRAVSLEQTARSFVELLDKGEFAKATNHFDAAMRKALPPDELKKTWQTVLARPGAYKKQAASRRASSGKYEIVYVTCEFARAKEDARVVFDKDGRITGLFFRKPAPKGVEELWEGTLKVAALEIRLLFHLFKQKDGSYAGTMDSPDQGADGIVLNEVQIKNDAFHLELKSAKIVFDGKRNKDGRIIGDFKQGGQSFPLTLKRVAKVKKPGRPQIPKNLYP